MLASVGGSLDSLDEASEGAALAGAPYSSFDGEEGSFLMALRQPKRKSIRQVWRQGQALLRVGQVAAKWFAQCGSPHAWASARRGRLGKPPA